MSISCINCHYEESSQGQDEEVIYRDTERLLHFVRNDEKDSIVHTYCSLFNFFVGASLGSPSAVFAMRLGRASPAPP